MALDTKLLQKVVGDLIKARVGDDLAKLPNGKHCIGAARIGNVKFKYPYATLDIIDISDTNDSVTNKSKDENGFPIYETHTDVLFQISVRSDKRNSYQLARKIHKAFSFETYRDQIYAEAEATIGRLGDLTPIPDVLSTKQIEFNTFNVTLRVNDKELVEDEGYITAINTTGTITSSTGEVTDVDIVTDIVDLWTSGVYNYSGTWVFTDTWGQG